MSQATSVRGEAYEESIRSGFIAQNRHLMEGGQFEFAGETIRESFTRQNGTVAQRAFTDINAQFVAARDFRLRDAMPVASVCHDPNFQVTAGTHVQLECTTTEGANLMLPSNRYMARKIEKHDGLVSRLDLVDYQSEPGAEYVLIFMFNGADHAQVHRRFMTLCSKVGVRGTTVYMPSTTADQWALSVENNAIRLRACRELMVRGLGDLMPAIVENMTVEKAIVEWGYEALGLPEPEVP